MSPLLPGRRHVHGHRSAGHRTGPPLQQCGRCAASLVRRAGRDRAGGDLLPVRARRRGRRRLPRRQLRSPIRSSTATASHTSSPSRPRRCWRSARASRSARPGTGSRDGVLSSVARSGSVSRSAGPGPPGRDHRRATEGCDQRASQQRARPSTSGNDESPDDQDEPHPQRDDHGQATARSRSPLGFIIHRRPVCPPTR